MTMKRIRKTGLLTFALPDDLRTALEAEVKRRSALRGPADVREVSVSQVIRELLIERLAQIGHETAP